MNDPLISLLTQAQLQGIRSGTSSSSATAVPPALARLPTGTILSGRIMGRDAGGNPILRTEQGDLPLHTDFKLRSGSEVVIRLESSLAGLRARILSIDGLSPKLAAQQQPPSGDTVRTALEVPPPSLPGAEPGAEDAESPLPSVPRPAGDALRLSLPRDAVFRAILLTRSDSLPEVIQQLPPSVQISPQRLTAGAQVSFRIVASDIPLQAAAPSPAPHLPGTPAPAALPSPGNAVPAGGGEIPPARPVQPPPSALALPLPADGAAQAPSSPLTITRAYVPGNPYAAYQKNILPAAPRSSGAPQAPSAAAPFPAPALPGNAPAIAKTETPGLLPAQVIGTEKSGDIVLNTPLGTLKLPAAALPVDVRLPVGSRLTLEPLSLKPPPAGTPPATSGAKPLPATAETPALSALSGQWPALEELIATLHQFDPAAAARFTANSLPNTGGQLTAGLVFFIAALRGGDVRQWLGQRNVELLERHSRGDLLRSLSADFHALRGAFQDSPSPNWHAVFFPVMHDEELRQARLFIKKDERNPRAAPDQKKGLRFIVEVELSELGDMQLDGFVKKKDQDTRFDLVVRTLKPLAGEHRLEILRIFGDAAAMTGFKGQVQFSRDDVFPVLPLDEVLDHGSDVTA